MGGLSGGNTPRSVHTLMSCGVLEAELRTNRAVQLEPNAGRCQRHSSPSPLDFETKGAAGNVACMTRRHLGSRLRNPSICPRCLLILHRAIAGEKADGRVTPDPSIPLSPSCTPILFPWNDMDTLSPYALFGLLPPCHVLSTQGAFGIRLMGPQPPPYEAIPACSR